MTDEEVMKKRKNAISKQMNVKNGLKEFEKDRNAKEHFRTNLELRYDVRQP